MPYFIQVLREYTVKVDELKELVETKLEESVSESNKSSIVYGKQQKNEKKNDQFCSKKILTSSLPATEPTLMITAGAVPNAGYSVPGQVPGAGYPGYGQSYGM